MVLVDKSEKTVNKLEVNLYAAKTEFCNYIFLFQFSLVEG